MDLDKILERCGQGDDLAWEALVRRYQGRVFGVAMHYMRNREEAEDVAQEAFVKLYRGLSTLEGSEGFLAWLLRLTRNCAIDRLRRLKVRTPEQAVRVEDAPDLLVAAETPRDHWQRQADKGLLYRAMEQLSEQSREMILLKEIQELKMKEVAELLALPMGTVKSRSHRARLELADAIRTLDPSYGT